MLECDSRTIECVARVLLQKLVVWVLHVDSMQFCGDLLGEILGESAPSSKKLHLKQNAIEWSKTFVTDARRL